MASGGSVRVVIPGYEQFELLGTGGFSRVFKAYQPKFRRSVAIKILNFDVVDERAVKAFERECFAMGQVSSHPNIVTVLDNGLTNDDRPFIVMEYFSGGTYSDKLAEGQISIEELLRVGVKISGALQTAHDAGVLHRDLKPHNIFVSTFNEPALGDFGLSTMDQEKTSTGFAGYTVHYAPPEVLNGKPATMQSDLYSLGATFYRLIEGLRPFDGPDQSVVATAVRIITEPPPTITRSDCPAELKTLVDRLMSKEMIDRPQSASEVASNFQTIQDGQGFRVSDVVLPAAASDRPSGAAPPDLLPDLEPTTLRSVLELDANSTSESVESHDVGVGPLAAAIEMLLAGAAREAPVPDATTVRSVETDDELISAQLNTPVAEDSGDARPREDAFDRLDDPDATIVRSSLLGSGAPSPTTSQRTETEHRNVDDGVETVSVADGSDDSSTESAMTTGTSSQATDDVNVGSGTGKDNEPTTNIPTGANIADQPTEPGDNDRAAGIESAVMLAGLAGREDRPARKDPDLTEKNDAAPHRGRGARRWLYVATAALAIGSISVLAFQVRQNARAPEAQAQSEILATASTASVPATQQATTTTSRLALCDRQESVAASECTALVAIYNATNGPGWTQSNGWLSNTNVCGWYGVNCSNANNVVFLDLDNNNLSGSIPPEVGDLTSLVRLELNFNKLSGPIPSAIGELVNLGALNLSQNQLTGPVPIEMLQLDKLLYLALADQAGCLTVADNSFGSWLSSFGPVWNNGC